MIGEAPRASSAKSLAAEILREAEARSHSAGKIPLGSLGTRHIGVLAKELLRNSGTQNVPQNSYTDLSEQYGNNRTEMGALL
jgi:hypothetical protein